MNYDELKRKPQLYDELILFKERQPLQLNHTSKQLSKRSSITDDEVLQRSYGADNDVYVHDETLYVYGTTNADTLLDSDPVYIFNNIKAHNNQDMIDDLKKNTR